MMKKNNATRGPVRHDPLWRYPVGPAAAGTLTGSALTALVLYLFG
jgi:hypothetical protein